MLIKHIRRIKPFTMIWHSLDQQKILKASRSVLHHFSWVSGSALSSSFSNLCLITFSMKTDFFLFLVWRVSVSFLSSFLVVFSLLSSHGFIFGGFHSPKNVFFMSLLFVFGTMVCHFLVWVVLGWSLMEGHESEIQKWYF